MIVPIVLAASGVFCFVRDARMLRTGVLWLAALAMTVPAAISLVRPEGESDSGSPILGWVMLSLLGAMLLMVLVLTVYLIVNGLTMLRREQRTLANLLSLATGLAMLAYIAVCVAAVLAQSQWTMIWLILLLPPIGYVAFAFTAYLLYSLVYASVAWHRSERAAAVVVLGAGLRDGEVTPLIEQRIRAGLRVRERCLKHDGRAPLMVASGGQGPDEPRSEADAMAERLRALGVPDDQIAIEDRSRTTEQNLRFSQDLLQARDVRGPIVATTSDYHAFRAAMLLRRLGIPGQAVGGHTARYYRPSATIREFIAVLRDSLALNVTMLGLLALPLLVGAVVAIFRL
ncbi:YdcF family protein [Pseudoclavibacter sp. CFCC 13796]|uniref:YdcF family protein n=1 Tax=Pseudoclavibacter sp. CFCC 13796 TaxID=2615179 RepID=UPI0017884478|nr:YdcF family protein [Pseudoclavibacter sp. CFCC 13796]